MKTRISLLCAAGALMAIVSGCTTTELSQTPLTPAEAQWAEYIGYSYSEWKPPRTAPPSATAAEPVVLPDQVIIPAVITPVEPAPAPLPAVPPTAVPAVEKNKVEAQTYTIQKGDTLSNIAKKMYGKASKWNVILDANKDKISDAGKLKVGMTINIPAQ
ncbi:MAG: LysM peptidoglycan-binding domain-containing protein [Victivallales bacterium]|jgi:nucleoid-associated protein YgaU